MEGGHRSFDRPLVSPVVRAAMAVRVGPSAERMCSLQAVMGVGGGKSVPKSRPFCNQMGGATDARMECSGLPPAKGLAPLSSDTPPSRQTVEAEPAGSASREWDV